MNHPERSFRRITSMPPRTSLNILRGAVTIRIGGGSLLGGAGRVSRESTTKEVDWSKIVAKHVVFQKPAKREKTRSEPLYGRDGKIDLRTDFVDDYNGRGDLGVILQFAGIGLTGTPFLRGRRNYGPDSVVFYTKIGYRNKIAYLILATRGDIFESQIVPAQMDVNPFFREELYLPQYAPQFATIYNPVSMTVFQNNRLVIVGYNPLTTR